MCDLEMGALNSQMRGRRFSIRRVPDRLLLGADYPKLRAVADRRGCNSI